MSDEPDPYTGEAVDLVGPVEMRDASPDPYTEDPYGVMPALDGPATYLKATGGRVEYMTDEEKDEYEKKRARRMARLFAKYNNKLVT